MENSNDTIKVIGALLAGALVGAALGILFAPDKGSETRARIATEAKDIAANIKKKFKNSFGKEDSQTEEG